MIRPRMSTGRRLAIDMDSPQVISEGTSDSGGPSSDLRLIGERRVVRIAGVRFSGRRRRPSGEKEPLPREFRGTGTFWAVIALLGLLIWALLFLVGGSPDWWTRQDMRVLLRLEEMRTDAATAFFKGINLLTADLFVRVVRWGVILALIFYRRWRHLVAGMAVFLIVDAVTSGMVYAVARPRPLVEILVPREGYSHPSVPVASVAATLGVIGYSLIPKGKWRNRWFIGSGVVIFLAVVARVYLGVDHPSDAAVAALFALAVSVVVFKLFVPESVFPVTYSHGKSAHLDISGDRGEAIKNAVQDQLGLEVTYLGYVGLAGSAGSTPLQMNVRRSPDSDESSMVFAKLYAQSHLRADRWYKWGRTVVYGTLEDEVRFSSVRRLVEYEDYMMRVMRDAGIPCALPYGFVEITPEREYLIVTEFLDGAVEISEVELTDDQIDEGLEVIRRLWDAGLAHRDVKPANIMVRDGHVVLIDVAFGQVRPTPWRQAVDLANMMLVLALSSDPERVYNRALQFFSPDDVAEAFAATRSVSVPSQSRSMLRSHRKDSRVDLVASFRDLAPPRERISIQRWSRRRVVMAAITVIALLMLVSFIIDNLRGQGFI
jgi:tRNA A-37 threonylcarbamoyl transferase component Bud32/membrane-associated phospholipid phosphatase